jgi:hypothetical protein
VRWEDLFADLERHWEGLAGSERQAEVAERTRAELAAVPLLDRLRAAQGDAVRVAVTSEHRLAGRLARVGADFLLLEAPPHEYLVPTQAVVTVEGVGASALSAEAAGAVASRLGLGSALRRVAGDRAVVSVVSVTGVAVSGRVQRVGADFLELAVTSGPEPEARAQQRLLVPFTALALVRREATGSA